MKKALIVSYNFPPVGGAGVQRPVKFVKYLREFGWEPVVLRVANPSVPVLDPALLQDIPEGVAVYGARTLEPSYAAKQGFSSGSPTIKGRLKGLVKRLATPLLLPDPQVLWWPHLARELVRLIRIERPRLIFVSAPPFSSFLPVVFVGGLLGVPVVLDYRDEWAFSRAQWENAVKHGLARRLDTFFERFVLSRCTAFTAANLSYVASIGASYPGSAGKGRAITNGYDEDDFAPAPPGEGKKVSLVYTGTVWKATSLNTFAAALKLLLERDPGLAERLEVKIFGRVVDAELSYLEDPELAGVVRCFGYLEHARVTAETMAADVLLVTLTDLPGAEKIITGKAFEYMASGRQILALVPPGETRELLAGNYNKVTVVDPGNVEGIGAALAALVRDIDAIRATPGSDVSRFSRRTLTGALAALFDEVAPL